jgi:hypothetical protein
MQMEVLSNEPINPALVVEELEMFVAPGERRGFAGVTQDGNPYYRWEESLDGTKSIMAVTKRLP